ncbi:MAG: hypothetical protein JNM07_06370 [Phycisphaerae bacterium]|nr:hypothetical protein [Phycisphaerae bacterium]
MKHLSCFSVRSGFVALAGAALTALSPATWAQPQPVTEPNFIAGTMDIDFATRSNLDASGDLKDGSPALGAKDTYKFALSVGKTTEFAGSVQRQPNLYTKMLQRRKQDALLTYSIDLSVLNPKDLKQKKVVGKWVGTVPIDTTTGAYDLAGGKAKESPLRISVDAVGTAKAFQDLFQGRLMGKAEKKENLAAYTYKRVIGDRTVQVVVKKSDPMRFENLVLAMGPAEVYPRTTVSGRLDYDYETGNWYTDGIRFKYQLDGKDFEDTVTGSIKWVEDTDRATNGKGYYDFNLRFNEGAQSKAKSETAAFEKMSEEDAFFAVDDSVPSLTGRVSYVDTMNASGAPTSSKVAFALNANKLTKQQAMNFFKLWIICIGPTNDE